MKKQYFFLILFLTITGCSPEPSIKYGAIKKVVDFGLLVPQSDYVIYSDCATLPTLYAGISMLTHTKESYIYMAERSPFDTSKFPAHVTSISSIDAMRIKIDQLNKKNPKSTFTLYVNDLRVAKAFKYFYSQGISADRVKIILLNDGTKTYAKFRHFFSPLSGFNTWNAFAQEYYTEFNKNPKPDLNIDYFHQIDGRNAAFFTIPAISDNTYFWIQWPELLGTSSIDLYHYLVQNSQRYYKVDPFSYFQSLSADKQDKFIQLVGLDKKWALGEGHGTLQNQTIGEALDASPKPNIIITGTRPYGQKTDKYIKKIKAKYGNEYDYFFKGHPADPTHPSDKSIVVLPFKLPMEAILWIYGNKIDIIGGYQSSLYMNTKTSMKKFFFGHRNGSSLLSPLDIMYEQGLLGTVNFIP